MPCAGLPATTPAPRPAAADTQVHLQHKRHLREREAALREAWVELFRDLMLLRWPDAVDRSSSRAGSRRSA
jgi:hypothetical protein